MLSDARGLFSPAQPSCCVPDATASGRFLRHIEEYLQSEVLPLYGNPHSTVSQCANQSTSFREQARCVTDLLCYETKVTRII